MSTDVEASKRRTNGGITRVVRKDGTVVYRLKVDAGTTADGRRRQKVSTHPTKRAAEIARGEALKAPRTARPTGETFSEYAARWVEDRHDLRPSTRDGYRRVLEDAGRDFGDKALDKVTDADLSKFQRRLLTTPGRRGAPRSPRSANLSAQIVTACLRDAHEARLIETVPKVRKAREVREEFTIWKPSEVAAFLAAIDGHPHEAGLRLATRGLRRGEVLGLQRRDVDLDAGTVAIRRAYTSVAGVPGYAEPKSARGRRTLPMDADTLAVLRRALDHAPSKRPTAPLVHDDDGAPVRPEAFSDAFAAVVKAEQLTAIRLHDLRHTSASTMLRAGVDPVAVATWHGHSVQVLLSTYAHLMPDRLEAAGAALTALFGSASDNPL